jgi:hypothetical protein
MAKDLDADRPEGKLRQRDFEDGTGAVAPAFVIYDADGNAIDSVSPLPVEVIDPLTPLLVPAVHPLFGENIHDADGSFSGTELEVYNADDTLWTATEEIGSSFTAVTSEQAHTGTNSAKWTGPSVGDVIQFADPTPPQALSGHVALTFWVYITAGYGAGNSIEVYGWDGAVVGNRVAIETKINQLEFGIWQLVSITLVELGLAAASIDAVRLEYMTKAGLAPTLFVDDMGFQESAGAVPFLVAAPPGLVFEIRKIYGLVVDVFDASVLNGTMPGLDPLALLGSPSLTNGMVFALVQNGLPTPLAGVLRNFCDFFFLDFELQSNVSNGGNTCVKLVLSFDHPIILTGDPALNHFSLTIQDDMRGFTRVHLIAVGGFRLA